MQALKIQMQAHHERREEIMTLSEIQSLREEKPGEFDAMVCRLVHSREDLFNEKKGGILIPKSAQIPSYHSDANADLLSHRVACGWLFSKRMQYLMELSRLWDSRYKTDSKITGFQLVSKYEVGDFSQIALATVMEYSAKWEWK